MLNPDDFSPVTAPAEAIAQVVRTHLECPSGWVNALLFPREQEEIFVSLCNQVGRRLSLTPQILTQKLPPLPAWPLAQLSLSVRARNCLAKAGYEADIAALSNLTIGDLMELPAFGIRSLVEVLVAMEDASASLKQNPMPPPMQEQSTAQQGKQPFKQWEEAEETEPHHPPIGELLSALDDEINHLRESTHDFAALLHRGFEVEKAASLRQRGSEALNRCTALREELEALAQGMFEGSRVAMARDAALGEEVTCWISLLQNHPGARQLRAATAPAALMVWMQRAREKVGEANANATLGEWIQDLAEAEKDPPSPLGLARDLAELRRVVEEGCSRTLEAELGAIIETFEASKRKRGESEADLPTRLSEIIRGRLGWNGEKARTLDDLGKQWKVARQRIDGILKPFEDWFDQHTFFTPVLEQALHLVQQNLPMGSEELALLLQSSGVTQDAWSLEALADTARSLGREPGFVVTRFKEENEQDLGFGIAWDGESERSKGAKPLPQRLWKAVATHIWERGIGFIPDLEAEIVEVEGAQAVPLLHSILESHSGVRWLHHEQGWFWLEATRVVRRQENRLLTQITRALSVARRLSLPRLQAAVTRVHLRSARSGYDWEMPPEEIFAEWCQQQSRFRIDEGEVEMLDTPPWTEVLDNTEATLVRLLTENGPLLTRWKFYQLCAEHQIPKPTFYIYVDGLATIEEVEEGIFALTGATITPEQLESFQDDHANFSKRFWLRYGRLDDNRLWMSYRISQGRLNNGTLNLPLRMRGAFHGRYELVDWKNAPVGTLAFSSIQCWGFRHYFRTQVALGDRVTVIISQRHHQAQVFIGLDELPDPIFAEVENLDSVNESFEQDD